MAIGIALLGAGIFAKREHLPAIEAAEQLELKAVYSRSKATAETLLAKVPAAAQATVGVYYDEPAVAGRELASLLARADVAAVSVCLPIALQPAVVRAALAAGKHVISEKPVGPTAAAARELIAAYRALPAPRPLWAVAENYRFQPGLRAAAEAARGLGGTLVGFQLQSDWNVQADGAYVNTAWRKVPTHPGGFLLDGGVHFVAALRLLLEAATPAGDAIAQVAGFAVQLQPHMPPADTLRAVARTRRGVSGTLSISFGTEFGGPPLDVAVATTAGRVAWSPDRIVVTRRDAPPATVDLHDAARFDAAAANGVRAEFAAFAASIAAGATAVDAALSPEEALQDVALIEAMLLSGAAGGALRTV